jgi:hypothetical protein
MKAVPAAQLNLLDLQSLDTKLAQLAHRRATIPELELIRELAVERRALADVHVAVATQVSDLTRAQARAEADVEAVRVRIARDRDLMDSGRLGSAKQMQDVARELESLARRVAALEDAELEVMEKLEAASERLVELDGRVAELAARDDSLRAALAAAQDGVDKEVERVTRERERVVASVPADLLALYDKVRRTINPAAAALFRGRCMSCQMQLSPADLAALRSAGADEVCRCEECRAILVRTAESGL